MKMQHIYFLLLALLSISIKAQSQTLQPEWIICNDQGCKLLDPYFSEGVSVKWDGSCVDGKANGYGKLLKYKKGKLESTYEGDYKNGIREGKGIFTHSDGSVKQGAFVNGQLTGKGEMESDGNKYIGEFINYCLHGNGILFLSNGAKFEGYFVSNHMYTGKYTNKDGTITFIEKGEPVSKIENKNSGYKPEIGVEVTEYFDEKWNRCKKRDASYYRLITYEAPNKPKGLVRDYYLSGQIQAEFYAVYLDYDDDGKSFYEGEETWYHKNGAIEQKKYYYNNKLNGKNTFYNDNGKISSERIYSFGVIKSERRWSENGKLKIIAVFEDGELKNNKYIEFDENGIGTQIYKESFYKDEEKWEANIFGKAKVKAFCDDRESDMVELLKYDILFKTSGNGLVLEKKQVLQISKNEDDNRFSTSAINIPLDQQTDFSIEAKFLATKNILLYGILIGDVEGDRDWDMFLLKENGCAFFGKYEGVEYTIFNENSSNVIKNQANLIKLLKLGDKFIFSVNGQVVKSCDAKLFRSSNIGFSIYGQGECTVGDLVIREIYSPERSSQIAEKDESSDWKGNGSGFFINEKGYIATNFHVIENANDIQIEFLQKGKKLSYTAKVMASDKQNDLAILKIDDVNFITLPRIPYVFNISTKDVGTEVFTLGYPIANIMGDEVKFTDGKISSKTGIQGDVRVYQISAPIQPGNSGGPLFDSKGNLIGITSSALNKEYFNSENVNYAIKCAYLKSLIDVLSEPIDLPNYTEIYNKPLTEKIKILTDFIPIIKVR